MESNPESAIYDINSPQARKRSARRAMSDITPWSFYYEQPDKQPYPESQPRTYKLYEANSNSARSPLLEEPSVVITPAHAEEGTADPLRFQSIPKPKQSLKISEILHNYLQGQPDSNSYAYSYRKTEPLKTLEKVRFPHLYFNKKSSRLLPRNFSQKDQLVIRSIFANYSEEEQFDKIKREKVVVVHPPKRRCSNGKVLFSGVSNQLSPVEEGIQIKGKQQRILRRPARPQHINP